MSEQQQTRPTLGLHQVVRNEEQALPRALNSVRDLVDEIVISVDPTTTDHTWDIAEAWLRDWDPTGEKWTLFQGLSLEEHGFAAARNAVLEKVKSDWVLAVDADEWLPNGEIARLPGPGGIWQPQSFYSHNIIRAVLEQVKPEFDVIIMHVVMLDDEGRVQTRFQGERLFRKHKRYVNPVHNILEGPTASAGCDAAVFHSRKERSEAERKFRGDQRLKMAEKFFIPMVEKNPEDSRSLFYLAGTYGESGGAENAEKYYRLYLKSPNTWPNERYQAIVFLLRAMIERARSGKPKEREEIIAEARTFGVQAIADNYGRAEVWSLLGQLAHEVGDFHQAIFFYKIATTCEFKVDPHFVETATHSWFPWLQLATVYWAVGESEKAEEAFKAAGERDAPQGPLDNAMKYAHAFFPPAKRIGVFIGRAGQHFIDPLMKEWAKVYQIGLCNTPDALQQLLDWCDLAWFEWADSLLVDYTTKTQTRVRTIVRVHGWEVYAGFIPQVNWVRVDTVIFPTAFLRDIAVQQAPAMRNCCQLVVMPGGVQTDRYTIAEGKTGNKACLAGYINHKKGIEQAVQVFYEAWLKRPELELHIAGTVQDPRIWLHMGTLIDELGLRQQVHFYEWQDELNAWYADKDYFLSTSTGETFHYSLAEGMAAGLKPVIHCWKGSRDIYGDEWVYRTVAEGAQMLLKRPTAKDRKRYRQFIVDRYGFPRQKQMVDFMLSMKTASVIAPDANMLRHEVAIAQGTEELGFGIAAPEMADVVVFTEAAPEYLDMARRKEGQKRVLWYGGDDPEMAKAALGKVDAIVASSPQVAAEVGTPHVVYMGGARDIWQKRPDIPKTVDVGFYGHVDERRKGIIERLGARLKEWNPDLNLQAVECWDANALPAFVQGCKVALNLHSATSKQAERRVSEILATGTFCLSEKLAEGHPFPPGLMVEAVDENELATECQRYLEQEREREEIAERGHKWVWRNLTATGQVEKMLEAAGMRWAQ